MEIKKFENFTPGGWVNVKIDEQLFIRMEKYVYALDTLIIKPNDKYDLFKKVDALSNINDFTKDCDIQTKISIITLLQYLNEIKSYFNPSSAGFLLEGFLATLIHGKMLNDYGSIDITSSYNELDPIRFKTEGNLGPGIHKRDYQIKLYKSGSNIKLKWEEDKICDYYVICLKVGDDIDVHILDGKNKDLDEFVGNYASISRSTKTYERDGYIIVNTNKLRSNNYKRTLKISNVAEMIEGCGDDIRDSLKNIYDDISELHYNIDSLVSGYDKERKKISVDDAKLNSDGSLIKLSNDINTLSKGLS